VKALGTTAQKILWSLSGGVLILLIWQFIPLLARIPQYVIPSPENTFKSLGDNWPTLAPLLQTTLTETIVGFLIGTVFGFLAAVLMAQLRLVQRVIYPMLIGSQAVPIVSIAAPLVIILGFGMAPKLVIVALIVFFPVVVNVLDGLNRVDQDYLALAKSMGASQTKIFLLVRLPATLTPLFSALKLSATYAVTGAVIGEWTASTTPGVGNDLLQRNATLDVSGVWADVVLLTAVGLGGFLLMLILEYVATPWRTKSTARGRISIRKMRPQTSTRRAPSLAHK
jgi:ABC-type nitrate/sulfonate/bicarbonate transport system permease component